MRDAAAVADDIQALVAGFQLLVNLDFHVVEFDLYAVEQRIVVGCAGGDTPFILRLPVIPGVNDHPEHFETAAQIVRGAKALVRVELLPYQRAAGAKYEMVGRMYQVDFDEARAPRMYTECFDREGIAYQVFR